MGLAESGLVVPAYCKKNEEKENLLRCRPTPCDSTSPQCCFVVKAWNHMKYSDLSFNPAEPNACCSPRKSGILGVTCTTVEGVTTVTKIDWSGKQLNGSIHESLGSLVYLQEL